MVSNQGTYTITLLTFTLQLKPSSLMSPFFWKPGEIIYYGTLAYTKYSMNKPLTLSAVIVKQSSCGIYFFKFMEMFFLFLGNNSAHWNQRPFTEDPPSSNRLTFGYFSVVLFIPYSIILTQVKLCPSTQTQLHSAPSFDIQI